MKPFKHTYTKNKYRAVKSYSDGWKFDSKLEARRNDILQLEVMSGEVIFYLRQVPFHLKCGVKYIVDFQIFYANGLVTFEDVKGIETPEFKIKKKMVEDEFPIKIDVVKRGDF